MYQVMIVEDDPMVASVVKTWLENCGEFQVTASLRAAEDAMALLRGGAAELLMLDLALPGMGGLELLAAIRAEQLPVEAVIASADDSPAAFRRARHLGALDYLLKPFGEARLRQAAALFLRSRRLYESGARLTQPDMDSVLPFDAAEKRGAAMPAKGIQAPTLSLVRGFLARSAAQRLTNESIAAGTGLSVVSIRRYMGYLAGQGEVSVGMEYNTGGRPVTVYHVL